MYPSDLSFCHAQRDIKADKSAKYKPFFRIEALKEGGVERNSFKFEEVKKIFVHQTGMLSIFVKRTLGSFTLFEGRFYILKNACSKRTFDII